jgi:hypothetical protein
MVTSILWVERVYCSNASTLVLPDATVLSPHAIDFVAAEEGCGANCRNVESGHTVRFQVAAVVPP